MDDAEFDRLLHAHMFGAVSGDELKRLVDAALASSDRALEFARVEELRETLIDPAFRRSLLKTLPAVQLERRSFWRQWLTPMFIAPLAAGAAITVALLVFYDPGSGGRPSPVAAGPSSGSANGAASNQPGTPSAGTAATPGAELFPAGSDDRSSKEMAALFDRPLSGDGRLHLRLANGERYQVRATVTASVTVAAEGRLFAFVRGPLGQLREVFPSDQARDDLLATGAHTFAFAAAGRLDPDTGGRVTLRVFFVDGAEVPPGGAARWSWLADRGRGEEVVYEIVP